jgi:hypothetical protein
MKWRNAAIATAVIFLMPVPITASYKVAHAQIGGAVLAYSLIAGAALALLWIATAWKQINGFVAILVFGPLGILEAILLLNTFIFVTELMGKMDYQLM